METAPAALLDTRQLLVTIQPQSDPSRKDMTMVRCVLMKLAVYLKLNLPLPCMVRGMCSRCCECDGSSDSWHLLIGDGPELLSDYPFFRDQKGARANKEAVLATRNRKSNGLCALVVPQRGVGGGVAVKQHVHDIKTLWLFAVIK